MSMGYLIAYAHHHAARPPNPPPGEPGHDHWGGPPPSGLNRDMWAAYGDRFPGSFCRWLSDNEAGRAVLAERRRGQVAS